MSELHAECENERTAMQMAVRYYNWCVEHKKHPLLGSGHGGRELAVWIKKYAAAVKYKHCTHDKAYDSVTKYLTSNFGKGFFGSDADRAMDMAISYTEWKNTGKTAFNHEEVVRWANRYNILKTYPAVSKYLEDVLIDTPAERQFAKAVEYVDWYRRHGRRPMKTGTKEESSLSVWFRNYSKAFKHNGKDARGRFLTVRPEVSKYLEDRLGVNWANFAVDDRRAELRSNSLRLAMKFVSWCKVHSRLPIRSSSDKEERTLRVWFDRYALAAVHRMGRMVAYPSVTRYITNMLGGDALTKKRIVITKHTQKFHR